MAGQRTLFASAVVAEGGDAQPLHFAHQNARREVTLADNPGELTYVIAGCSNAAPVQLGHSLYEGTIKPNHFSALEGGIHERDDLIVTLRDKLQQSEVSALSLRRELTRSEEEGLHLQSQLTHVTNKLQRLRLLHKICQSKRRLLTDQMSKREEEATSLRGESGHYGNPR